MPFTTTLTEVTDAIRDVLVAAADELELKNVYYGPADLMPEFPSVLVRSGALDRSLHATHQFALDLNVIIDLFYGTIQSSEINQYEAEQKMDKITSKLHEDFRLGERVVFGFVTRIQPVTLRRNDVMIKTMEGTWTGQSRQTF
jgi:hypothetical protein